MRIEQGRDLFPWRYSAATTGIPSNFYDAWDILQAKQYPSGADGPVDATIQLRVRVVTSNLGSAMRGIARNTKQS